MKEKDPAAGMVRIDGPFTSDRSGPDYYDIMLLVGPGKWELFDPYDPVGVIRAAIRYAVQRDRARSGKRR